MAKAVRAASRVAFVGLVLAYSSCLALGKEPRTAQMNQRISPLRQTFISTSGPTTLPFPPARSRSASAVLGCSADSRRF